MTHNRFPAIDDPVTDFSRPRGDTEGHAIDHGRVIEDAENVQHYGVKGDGSDDTDALQEALDAVLRPDSEKFGKTLKFPWTPDSYVFGDLDWHAAERVGANDIWIRLELNGKLAPLTTINMPARRLHVVGLGGGVQRNFTDMPGVEIDGSNLDTSTDPLIELSSGATSVFLQGLCLSNVTGNGIDVDLGVCETRMRGVSVVLATSNLTGNCVRAYGGFGYIFEHCNFQASSNAGGSYALKLSNDGTNNDACRIVSLKESYIGGHGIEIANATVAGENYVFDRVLAEGLNESFLTIDASTSVVYAVVLRGIEMADNLFSPSSLINNIGTNTYNVSVEGCVAFDRLLKAGSGVINNLSFNEGNTTDTTVGQTTRMRSNDRFGRWTFGTRWNSTPVAVTGAAPDLGAGNIFTVTNSGATTVTLMQNGKAGQVVTLLFLDGNTTIQNNASCKLAGAANFVATASDTLTLVSDGSVWYETGRSVN